MNATTTTSTPGSAPEDQAHLTQASSSRAVPTRRVSFEEALEDLPRHFTRDGDLMTSHLIASLSAVFPDGEDFFVKSVRHYRDQITDPELKRQVAGFIGQESVHGREHRVLNDRLGELGYPTTQVEKLTEKGLAFRWKVTPKIGSLALTAALEHFTATLAEHLLTDEDLRNQLGHETVKNIFVWHALEESEHKAVAFDVYRAVGGSERLRVLTMKLTRILFVLMMVVQMTVSMAMDRATYNPRRFRKSWKQFWTSGIVTKELWNQLKDYDRKDFHPDDQDTEALVEQWRTDLFGDAGSLNEYLAGARRAA